MPSRTGKTTTDHDEIRRWAEERGASPAVVKRTQGGRGGTGIIRIDFPGYSGEKSLEHISWDEFFQKFDESGLALVYQDKTARGVKSNFNKLVARETVEAREEGVRTSRRQMRSEASRAGRGRSSTRAASAGSRGAARSRAEGGESRGTSASRGGARATSSSRAGASRAGASRAGASRGASSSRAESPRAGAAAGRRRASGQQSAAARTASAPRRGASKKTSTSTSTRRGSRSSRK